jgi:hypothetical protein
MTASTDYDTASEAPALPWPLGASRTRLRPFSQNRISKEIPPGTAVTPYFEVCTSVPLGVSRHFVKPQNMGSPPSHTVDAALRKGAWPQDERAKLNDTIPPWGMGVDND